MFQYPEGSPTPADTQCCPKEDSICFNTPKGHLHLQTAHPAYSMTVPSHVSIPRRVTYTCRRFYQCRWYQGEWGFNTPKGHLHLQTELWIGKNIAKVFQYPEGSPTPADGYKYGDVGVDMHCFNTPKGHLHLQTASTPVPATAPIPEFQYPEGSPTPADVLVRTPV